MPHAIITIILCMLENIIYENYINEDIVITKEKLT